MESQNIIKSLAGMLAGAVIGWTASALTLGGRVSAIEHAILRIEAHIDRIAIHTPPKGTP